MHSIMRPGSIDFFLLIRTHNSGKNSINLLKFNLILDLNTNGVELVQLLGRIVAGGECGCGGELLRGELTSTRPLYMCRLCKENS